MTISFADMPEVRPPTDCDDVVVLKVVGVGGGGGVISPTADQTGKN